MKWFVILIGFIPISSCRNKAVSTQKMAADSIPKIETTSAVKVIDTGFLKVSSNIDDPSGEYLEEALKPIRENFKRINSISNAEWSLISRKDLSGSAEGGEAFFYFYNNHLEKITTRYFGESGQTLTEYYLMNGALSFVFEKQAIYNRPIYYDSAAMKENNDTICFDIKQSEIIEDRRYFKDNKIISQINNQDCGAPDAPEYVLGEQKRVLADFDALMKLSANKAK